MTFQFIRDHADQFSVVKMCRVLKVSRSGYYAWCKRPQSARKQQDKRLACQICRIFDDHREVYGRPRIQATLRHQGVHTSDKRVARLMRECQLQAKAGRRRRICTTDSRHSLNVADNLLQRNFTQDRTDTVWVADITYIPTRQHWLYLSVVLDLCSRSVVGWAGQETMTAGLVLKSLTMALQRRKPPQGLIFHSDRGSQYASRDCQQLLQQHGIQASMSRKGDCYDNAVMESFFHTLKVELVHGQSFKNPTEAMTQLFEYIEVFYNRKRIHSHLDYRTPEQFEKSQRCA